MFLSDLLNREGADRPEDPIRRDERIAKVIAALIVAAGFVWLACIGFSKTHDQIPANPGLHDSLGSHLCPWRPAHSPGFTHVRQDFKQLDRYGS